MKAKKITGTVIHEDLGTGYWGILDEKGKEWHPANMPEQLKKAGKKVSLTVRESDAGFDIFMRGTPVEIVTFHT